MAIEYAEPVNAGRLDRSTFRVRDSIYNFRFSPIEDLPKLEDRTVTDVYTNRSPTKRRDGRSVPGRCVIVELDPDDIGGWTVIVSKCPTFLCTVKVNSDRLTRVIQRKDVYASSHHGHGKGRVISRAEPKTERRVSEKPVNLLVDEFQYGSFLRGGMVQPYDYRLPSGYDPERRYPLMIVLPGQGMGWDGDNTGVQLVADIPATAWMQSKWTGRSEDVIVLAPQKPARRRGRGGRSAAGAPRPVHAGLRGRPLADLRDDGVVRVHDAVAHVRQASRAVRRRSRDRRLPRVRRPGRCHRGR